MKFLRQEGLTRQISLLIAVLGGVAAAATVILTVHLERKTDKILLSTPVEITSVFVPSGWMGDAEEDHALVQISNVTQDDKSVVQNELGEVLKFTVKAGPRGWTGICWQYPINNWGERPGASVKQARKLTFFAAGSEGGEVLEFRVGITKADSAKGALGPTVLKRGWERYEIELQDQDFSNVVTPFAWVMPHTHSSRLTIFYLKDIRLE